VSILSTPAILLRSFPYSETSQTLRFYTESHGVVSAIARGVRKASGRQGGTLSTFSEGILEATDVDQDELRAQLDEMRAQLDNLPQAQRAMMEGMMGAQIEQIEQMLGGEGGMEMTMTVKEIKVNAGRPGGGV
jgi:hypothetical protein